MVVHLDIKTETYRSNVTVYTVVILTSGDKHKMDIAIIDFDPKDTEGQNKYRNIFSYKSFNKALFCFTSISCIKSVFCSSVVLLHFLLLLYFHNPDILSQLVLSFVSLLLMLSWVNYTQQ